MNHPVQVPISAVPMAISDERKLSCGRHVPDMRKAKNIIGTQLNKTRSDLGWSQAALASECRRKGWLMTREIIARIETGARCITDYEVVLFAECLETDISQLLPSKRDWKRVRDCFLVKPNRRSKGVGQSRQA